MDRSSELSCEAGSFSRWYNTHRFLQPQVLRLSFPLLEPWVVWSVLLPSCSSRFVLMHMWDCPVLQALPCGGPLQPGSWLSATPTSLDECFFFKSLVVGLPCSSIFWQFWLFFFFILSWFLSFFWLYKEAEHIYLHLNLGQKFHKCS